MKKYLIVLISTLLVAMLAACNSYTCDLCGKKTGTAYYDPFNTSKTMCKECAIDYLAPFPIEAYRK